MIGGLTILLMCQLAGEVLARALRLPVPGLGMLLLFVGLAVRWREPDGLATAADGIRFTRFTSLAHKAICANMRRCLHFKVCVQSFVRFADAVAREFRAI